MSNKNNKVKIDYNIKEKSKLHLIISICAIGITGFVLRMHYSPFEIPITLDGLLFFWYANDIALLGTLPLDYSPANNGWPIFLAFFFKILNSNNFMDLMALQRIISISLSTLTIIPIYFLGRKYFSEKLSVIGCVLFVFEPRIIQNSVLGITEPLFILLITSSIVCFLHQRKKIIIIAFALISFASIVRSEGIILLIPFTILYGIRFRNSKKIFYEIPILVLVFILIILPISVYRVEVTGDDSLLSRIPNIFDQINEQDQNVEIAENTQRSQKMDNIKNIIFLIGWASIPFFIFLIPYGIYQIIRNNKDDEKSLVTILFCMSIPAVYAISFLPDTRYLLILYPILSVISLFTVRKYFNKFSNKNIGLVILVSLILVSSIVFLEIKKIDVNHENESLKIAKIVSEKTEIINQYTTESGYLPIIGMQELEEFPILRKDFVKMDNGLKHCFNIHACNNIISVKSNDIVGFLQNSEEKGITHLVIDNKEQRRPSFVNEIFKNEDQFPYLTKIYDSKEDQLLYQVKIFEINFEEFNSLNLK
ncbi:MAG: glycosyltransferase family 39 protein [Nitrosopumilus sp.]|nr:glycosyltransferase family 39 protein [Nitrosopumilus sp.]